MNSSEEKLSRLLQTTSYNIPEEYYNRIDKVLNDIEHNTVTIKKEKNKSRRYIKAAAIILAFVLVSGTTYAAVNLYQQRMDSISEDEMKKYNEDVQKLQVDADGFSRVLTEDEQERMKSLRVQYEENGRFPTGEIRQVDNKIEEKYDYVYFVSSESAFYIPDRTLTDEELLEIIDLQEKRDYSVRNQNSAENHSIENQDEKVDATIDSSGTDVDNYMIKLAEIYGLDEGKLSIKSETEQDGYTERIIVGDGNEYTLHYSESDGLYEIILSKGDVPAHSFIDKINKKDISKVKKCITEKVPLFTNQQIEKMEMYYKADDNFGMVTGTISVYCHMADGKGCVAVYSVAYSDIYDIYTLEDSSAIKDIVKQKKKSAQRNNKQYVKI